MVEFVLPLDAALVAACRESLMPSLDVVRTGRPSVDLAFPCAVTVDMAAALRARRSDLKVRAGETVQALAHPGLLGLHVQWRSSRRPLEAVGAVKYGCARNCAEEAKCVRFR